MVTSFLASQHCWCPNYRLTFSKKITPFKPKKIFVGCFFYKLLNLFANFLNFFEIGQSVMLLKVVSVLLYLLSGVSSKIYVCRELGNCPFVCINVWMKAQLLADHSDRQPIQPPNMWTNYTFRIQTEDDLTNGNFIFCLFARFKKGC